jgi:hypothetical protein
MGGKRLIKGDTKASVPEFLDNDVLDAGKEGLKEYKSCR